ncbi:hypothetical protein MICRO80W_260025 [Micrococcus luteus]|nr:hypothetical protein MICRO80W_260025 [Micrococcus luteus]
MRAARVTGNRGFSRFRGRFARGEMVRSQLAARSQRPGNRNRRPIGRTHGHEPQGTRRRRRRALRQHPGRRQRCAGRPLRGVHRPGQEGREGLDPGLAGRGAHRAQGAHRPQPAHRRGDHHPGRPLREGDRRLQAQGRRLRVIPAAVRVSGPAPYAAGRASHPRVGRPSSSPAA